MLLSDVRAFGVAALGIAGAEAARPSSIMYRHVPR